MASKANPHKKNEPFKHIVSTEPGPHDEVIKKALSIADDDENEDEDEN